MPSYSRCTALSGSAPTPSASANGVHIVLAEPAQAHLRPVLHAREHAPRLLVQPVTLAAKHDDDKDRVNRQPTEQEGESLDRSPVGPLGVVEDDRQGIVCLELADDPQQLRPDTER